MRYVRDLDPADDPDHVMVLERSDLDTKPCFRAIWSGANGIKQDGRSVVETTLRHTASGKSEVSGPPTDRSYSRAGASGTGGGSEVQRLRGSTARPPGKNDGQ